MTVGVGDLVVVASFAPEIIPEKLGIFLDEGYTNGPHESCWVLTQDGIEEVNFYLVFPVDHKEDEQP